ncbi:ribosome small subunit-dependent GTPase A [Thermincola ferriacetica]|uniref:Small ribosomal subunit biogenesis GTPase RsgA n=1 Tax=Thermincola ferriacetica TaxID=281456 RepID=A0A0L6W008_9FIRM|nr:ribosome small subunit-dependent GTPase A [Thermincola ferriacetica]KNZ68743.1 ribosome small subunit-dependent GTPase A [Thermincola ferriacetica]
MIEGVVIKGYSGHYYVKYKGKIWECSLRGRFRLENKPALAGDRVVVRETGKGKGVIEEILPRVSELARPPIANVEMVVIVMAAKDPAINRELLDRMLVMAEYEGLEAVICINKCDLVDLGFPQLLKNTYGKAGYRVILTSTVTGMGIEDLRSWLAGRISVIAGPSGAGKSSLLNAVQPGLMLKTGKVSAKIGRGKHTTRHVELLELEVEGFVADTPGFSSLNLPEMETESLATCFPEFASYEGACKFNGCLHLAEPQCAVKNAVAQGLIDKSRYRSYEAFMKELEGRKRRY